MRASLRILAIGAAILFAAAGGARAGVLDLVRKACLDEPLPYGKAAPPSNDGERSFALAPGDPEHDRAVAILPPAPAGWSAEAPKIEVFVSPALGCGFRASQTFEQGGRDLIFALTFAAAVKDLADELAKPNPDLTPPERLLEFKGRKGYDRFATPARNLVLIVGNTALTINGASTEAEKRALLDATDLDAIEAFKF